VAYHNRPPRFPAHAGGPPLRAKFLDGTWKAYYGPGQPPDAGQPDSYAPPTVWNPSGSALRAPQVAWLNVQVPVPGLILGARGPYNPVVHTFNSVFTVPVEYSGLFYLNGALLVKAQSATPGDNAAATAQVEGHASSFGAWVLGPLDFAGRKVWTITVGDITGDDEAAGITSPMAAERDRLLDLFAAVITRLEAIRPGRTFARVVDPWGPGDPDPQADAYFADEPGLYWPMMAPSDADTDSYLGTDFLNLHCGTAGTTEDLFVDWDYTPRVDELDAARAATQPLAVAASGRFVGYEHVYFGLDLVVPTIPHLVPIAPPDPPAGYLALGLFEGGDDPDATVGGAIPAWDDNLGAPAVIAARYVAANATIDGWNATNAGLQAANNDILTADAAALTALDPPVRAAYAGATSLLGDVDDVVARLAASFRFDPDTGLDLAADAE
jgi:hypothetical protein